MSGRRPLRRASRHAGGAWLPCATSLLVALACSGPADIVGVVDQAEPHADEPGAGPRATTADDGAANASDVALLLAGRPMTGWPGEALEWPLSTPLGELFAGPPANERDERDELMPWPSRRVASGFARSSARGTGTVGARSPELDARLLILDGEEARRLLALMTSAGGQRAEPAAVFRDALGDVYRVSLESEETPLDATWCGGRMRREAFECTGRGPFD